MFLQKVVVALRLGFVNVCRVLYYRLSIATNLNPACRIKESLFTGDFFAVPPKVSLSGAQAGGLAETVPVTRLAGVHAVALADQPYDWFFNFMSNRQFGNSTADWWRIGDFGDGDIKGIWEISRFSWVPILALSAVRGNEKSIDTLNRWLADWCECNPTFKGPNWKCGQETSLRILNLALASLTLKETKYVSPALRVFLEASLARVYATRSYALAQDNNHGTSEGAGLFVGGAWLASMGFAEAERFAAAGREQLERLARRLINSSGGFSQYSVNYHRVVLDTLSIVELWRRALALPRFSVEYYERCSAAIRWLENLVDDESGDAPNIGSNDGAHLLEFVNPEYRNYRFSVQLAASIFENRSALRPTQELRSALQLFGIEVPPAKESGLGGFMDDDSGFACLRRSRVSACVRFPRFKFRPGHADALHVDLWASGVNVLTDGGTFSYNCDPSTEAYFLGVASHNTIQFDDRDQMLRLSRFLYGGWPKECTLDPVTSTASESILSVGYVDYLGVRHHRRVALSDNKIVVADRISGFARKAVLRWRMGMSDWRMGSAQKGVRLQNDQHGMSLCVSTDLAIDRAELVRGYSSKFYSRKEEIDVLELEVSKPGAIVTEIAW